MKVFWRRGAWRTPLLALMVMTLLAGLIGAGQAPATRVARAQGDEPVTLTWFMRWDQARLDNVAQPVIEEFEALHPNINIELENVGSGDEYWTRLQTTIAAGNAPDVIYPATHNAYALASLGALVDLTPYIERDGIDLAAYDPQVLDLYTVDGQVYGLPIDSAALVVFYNEQMFAEAGIEPPTEGWTWDEFLTTAQALTKDVNGDGRVDQYGVDNWTDYWPLIVWTQTGHNIFDDPRNPTEFLLDEPEAIAALQWLGDLSNVHGVMPSPAETADISDMFLAGRAAMKIIGHWRVPQYQENIADFEWNVAPLPEGQIAANRADGSAFAITAQSEHPEEAWEFVKFLAGPGSPGVERLLELQQMTPALVEYQNSDLFLNPESLPDDFNKEAFNAGRENLFTMYDPIHPAYDEIDAIETAELGLLWTGQVTAQEAVERMTPEIERVLEEIAAE